MSSIEVLPNSALPMEPEVAAPPGARRHCSYKTSTGKPCRYLALPGKVFCKTHVRQLLPDPDALAEELIAVGKGLGNPYDVADVMAEVFHAVLRRRISPREAGVLCYIGQTILHSFTVGITQTNLQIKTILMEAESDKMRAELDQVEGQLRCTE